MCFGTVTWLFWPIFDGPPSAFILSDIKQQINAPTFSGLSRPMTSSCVKVFCTAIFALKGTQAFGPRLYVYALAAPDFRCLSSRSYSLGGSGSRSS
jgi:hypothetical protein